MRIGRSFRSRRWRSAVALCAVMATGLGGVTGCSKKAGSAARRSNAAALAVDPALPGLSKNAALTSELETQRAQKQGRYVVRTRHLSGGKPKYTNRLILESSPYLLQHAHNPVNWYAWSEAAFERARREKKPVFLSIGYSTCHWCHVMERESFEDEEIARFINQNFIAVKVDREERPDIDGVYMKAVQLLTGRGGWPATLVLTPDKTPLFAGTYFPPRDGDRERKGLLSILKETARRFAADPAATAAQATELSRRIQAAALVPAGAGVPGPNLIERGARALARSFDPVWGGFGRAPKFPKPTSHELLLRYHRRTGDEQALRIVVHSLEQMAAGGIYDQLGGGFHRYATDARWASPHYEKMLYDNAELAKLYVAAYQASGREAFASVARETLDFAIRDLGAPGGGFFSATDAESRTPGGKHEEGYFFTWTSQELAAALEPAEARVARAYFAVPEASSGRLTLTRPRADAEVAKELGLELDALRLSVAHCKEKLLAARAKRPAPHRDEKILTAWNALMISALARTGFALEDPRYVQRAEAAAGFLLERLRDREGRLLRTFDGHTARTTAYLEDYAFAIEALLDVYEASSRPHWLEAALELQSRLDAEYADEQGGGYFRTGVRHEQLMAREKPIDDVGEPSGNAVALLNLQRLHAFTAREAFRQRAVRGFAAFVNWADSSPASVPKLLSALDLYHEGARQVLIVASEREGAEQPLLGVLRKTFIPNGVLAVARADAEREPQTRLVPFVESKRALRGKPTAYVCEQGSCELPTSDEGVFAKQLKYTRPLLEIKPAPLLEPSGPAN